MLVSIFQCFILVAIGIFLFGVLGAKEHKEKNLYFTVSFILLVLLLISLKIL